MNILSLVIDLLSSTAALVAIVATLIAWNRSSRKPIKIDRLVIHQKDKESTFNLVLKNRKDYPITINQIDCYTYRHFMVKKKTSEKPEYAELLSCSDRIASDNSQNDLMANAHTDIRFNAGPITTSYSKLLFTFRTTHGYQQLWCRNILIVPTGIASTYFLDYKRDFHSKLVAKCFYFWAVFRDSIGWKVTK